MHFSLWKGKSFIFCARDVVRQKLVSLTSQGRQVLSGIDRIFEEWDAVCFSGFTEQERCLYQDFVKRIAENAMEYRHSQINQKEGCTYDK